MTRKKVLLSTVSAIIDEPFFGVDLIFHLEVEDVSFLFWFDSHQAKFHSNVDVSKAFDNLN